MAITYKQQCAKCRKNYVLATYRERFPVCYDCQKSELEGEVIDPEMKELFSIPEELFKKNLFLRNIKINYLRYGKLSEKQIDAFKKSVEKMSEPDKKEK
ncbi:MAG: hypothetical protein HGA85_00420 [Nanoarchaeota archaeon]|nr:hypothetical protein [Nanoarchaeota archaeon]